MALAVWQAISPFVPHVFFGVSYDPNSGRVTNVYAAQLPPDMGIVPGDRVVERPDGDALRGFRLISPLAGDRIHVITAHGVLAVPATPAYYPLPAARSEALRHATGAVVIALAALLLLRRPGWMSFAFWLWAISELGGGDLIYALDWLPRWAGFAITAVFVALSYSGFALISFALRFPTGHLPLAWRWIDRATWTAFALSALASVALYELFFTGRMTLSLADASDLLAVLPLLAAAGILLWKRAHADVLARPKVAWASTAFLAAALARAVAAVFALSALQSQDDLVGSRLAITVSNVVPLLAIYPVLRYRLFDLGFVVSRATLYSVLTLAAFGTLAGVNWLAQHFVTERLADVVQPVVAIGIGLGYFRVRAWAQGLIERVLFREHFAAEAHLEATIRGLPFVDRAESVDEVLVADLARTLRLASAALFRLADDGFARAAAVGWEGDTMAAFRSDDPLARRLLADGPLVRLAAGGAPSGGFPAAPRDPVVAFGIVRRGRLSAIGLYGRHDNGTELEPDELQLMRRLVDAAAVSYETAEVASLRRHNELLERELRRLTKGLPE